MTNATILGGALDKKLPESELPSLGSFENFLFDAPLYAKFSLGDANVNLHALLWTKMTIDGYCPYCGKMATFFKQDKVVRLETIVHYSSSPWSRTIEFYIKCTRNEKHKIRYWVYINNGAIQKTGQYPSLADIANDEAREYKKFLTKEDANEFSKAIGLAAHGVGVGSFVYLRRIFENLISRRFKEKSTEEKWDEKKFQHMHLDEKIKLLKDDLPEFLVKNKKIYSILSLGIHELDEKKCRQYYDVMHRSIITILKEDKRRKEELDDRSALEKSINEILEESSQSKVK